MSFINWIFVLSILESLLRLHKSVCDNRNVATIATHDFSKVSYQIHSEVVSKFLSIQVVGPLEYTARDPGDLSITPLSSSSPVKVLAKQH